MASGVLVRLLRRSPLLTGDDVGGIEVRPVVLRGARLVGTVVLLRLSQEPAQGVDVDGQSFRSLRGLINVPIGVP